MIKNNSIPNVLGINKFNSKIIVFCESRFNDTKKEIKSIQVSSYYDSFSSDELIIFQEKLNENIKIVSSNFDISEIKGRYSIRSAINYDHWAAVANLDSRTYHLIKDAIPIDLEFYFKKSGQLTNELIYNHEGESVSFYDLKQHKIVKKIDVEEEFGISNSIRKILNSYPNSFQIITMDGEILSIGIQDFELKWSGSGIERITSSGGNLYAIANFKIKVINASTGEIKLETSLEKARQYGWLPTNEIIVGQDLIFCLSTEKEGQIAVVNRKNLELIEVVKTGYSIPFGAKKSICSKNTLYVLDMQKHLHIFEKEK